VGAALHALVDALAAPIARLEPRGDVPAPSTGDLTSQSFAAAIAATLPEGVIISDESNTSGVHLRRALRFARTSLDDADRRAIGVRTAPRRVGAARRVEGSRAALESDGSTTYVHLQAL